MKLLFKREQTKSSTGRAQFKLWGKIDLEDDEEALVKHYAFDKTVLIESIQPELMRKTLFFAAASFVATFAILFISAGFALALFLALCAGGIIGFFYYDSKRETIYVRDLLHGRHFTCSSVVELARKEAWLSTITGFLRQVMESARHWDGTEALDIPIMSPEDAKQLVIKGL